MWDFTPMINYAKQVPMIKEKIVQTCIMGLKIQMENLFTQ